MTYAYPKISIITPSYNQANYIERTILSVICQGYPNIEYIIIDGGSTDGCADIIKKYQDKIAYWVSEPDHGQTDAINKGLKKASGDILAWINSDDTYVAGAIQNVIKYFNEHPGVDLVYGDCYVIDEHDKILSNHRGKAFDIRRAITGDLIYQPATFFKRKMIEDLGFLDESFRYTMDYDLWLRAALKYNLEYIPMTLAQFRVHSASKTISQSERFFSEDLRVLDKLFKNNEVNKNISFMVYLKIMNTLMMSQQHNFIKFIDHMNDEGRIVLKHYQAIFPEGKNALKNAELNPGKLATIRDVENLLKIIFRSYTNSTKIDAPDLKYIKQEYGKFYMRLAVSSFFLSPFNSLRLFIYAFWLDPGLILITINNFILERKYTLLASIKW